jgi:hypothetical protein
MSKPFASSADTFEKADTLADGIYALTAEGDPNVGAVEGEDFLLESRATPAASRDWLKILREQTDKPVRFPILTHYHAVGMIENVGRVHRAKGSLKEAFEATHAGQNPDVQRLWDEFDGIENPRIWTAECDREIWAKLQG